jgi:hypothetical protein
MSRSHAYAAFFIPADVKPDRAVEIGISWLAEQAGEPLVLLHAKKMIDNNRLLGQVARQHRIRYEAPQTIRRGSYWSGGAILAPWASGDVIRCIDDDLAYRVSAVCIIGWRPDDQNHAAWIAARNALDLASGEALGARSDHIISDPVVRIALDLAERFVNHNNALVQAEDKAYLVRTLQELVRCGHRFDADEVATYAMATGWSGEEVKRIQEYGRRVLDGRSFRLGSTIGPNRGDCKHWESAAAGPTDT